MIMYNSFINDSTIAACFIAEDGRELKLTEHPARLENVYILSYRHTTTMALPFRKSIEPTEEQLLQFMHADTKQTYEMAGMTAKQRADLREAEVARWNQAQKSKSDKLETYYDTYTIGQQLGQGGAGYVFKAINSTGAEFAVKFLNPDTATEERRKGFKSELRFCETTEHKSAQRTNDNSPPIHRWDHVMFGVRSP
jgi:serine/threonine protein kinase